MKLAAAALLLAALAAGAAAATEPQLRYLGREIAPAIGGISGIDYDPKTDRWILVSDDRSAHGPSHFHLAKFSYNADTVGPLTVEATVPLLRPDGSYFSAEGQAGEIADAEAVRFDPSGSSIVWASEGDAAHEIGAGIRRAGLDGAYRGTVQLPPMFANDPQKRTGPRINRSIEGLAYTSNGALWVALEAPLYQDGEVASREAGALARITRLAPDGTLLAQYAYRLDPIVQALPGALADNGISEILCLEDDTLLVLERSGEQRPDRSFRFHVRLYLAHTKAATDVARMPALNGRRMRPMQKTLLQDFDILPGAIPDNLEAMAWGAKLADGKASLVLASDNNFAADQRTRFLVFELSYGGKPTRAPAHSLKNP